MAAARIYRANGDRGWGAALWKEMASEVVTSWELTKTLFNRNFKAKYRQTAFGFLWILIMPVVSVATFVFLSRSGVLNVGDIGVPYPPYALVSLTIWQIFAGGLLACTQSVSSGGSMVAKINFPKETLVLSSLGETMLDIAVRLVMAGIILAVYRITPTWTSLLLPLALIPLIFFTVGLGLIFAVFNVLIRDLGQMVGLANTFLLLVTPVLYQEPEHGPMKLLATLNPLTSLVGAPRDILFTGSVAHPSQYALFSAFSFLLFLTAWRLFHLSEERIAERMGAR